MKKRLFTLCLALTAMTLGTMAAEELYVGGKNVSLSGSGEVTVSGGDIKSGSVKYNRDTKTLTLSGVTITRSGNNDRGIRSSISGLTVKFVGTNKITTTSAAGLRFEASATITGSGTVTVKSNETAFYVSKNTTVTIKGADRNRLTLDLDGKYGIQGEDGNSSEKVSIQRYVTLTAKGSSNTVKYLNNLTVSGDPNITLMGNNTNATVNSLASLTLGEGVAIDLPLGGYFDSSKKTIAKAGYTTAYKENVTIKPAIVAINATNFPDENFRNYLLPWREGQHTYLTESEINEIVELNLNKLNIKDLTGIGYFKALKTLFCYGNSLTSLDVSKNTALTELYCFSNSLTSLNVSKNTALRTLNCNSNSLESLDVSKNTALEWLNCDNNSLESLDVSKNTALEWLDCESNGLKSLDVSKNTALTSLDCSSNYDLASLDVSKNTALRKLECSLNVNLTSLDVSKNKALTDLICDRMLLKSLDVSKNTALTKLVCYNNMISGAAMTQLVNSLRSLPSGTEGRFIVCDDWPETDNVITPAQVNIAKSKGWTVQKNLGYGNYVDYAGCGDANVDGYFNMNDLNLIVDIIMGNKPDGIDDSAGDLNKDGKTDAADVVLMVNILKELKGK